MHHSPFLSNVEFLVAPIKESRHMHWTFEVLNIIRVHYLKSNDRHETVLDKSVFGSVYECVYSNYFKPKWKLEMIRYDYLLDKIIPSILKVGPEEEAGPTLVCGVHRVPSQANQEHGPATLHLQWSWSEKPGQITLELHPVSICCALICAVDENLSFVVSRWSFV